MEKNTTVLRFDRKFILRLAYERLLYGEREINIMMRISSERSKMDRVVIYRDDVMVEIFYPTIFNFSNIDVILKKKYADAYKIATYPEIKQRALNDLILEKIFFESVDTDITLDMLEYHVGISMLVKHYDRVKTKFSL